MSELASPSSPGIHGVDHVMTPISEATHDRLVSTGWEAASANEPAPSVADASALGAGSIAPSLSEAQHRHARGSFGVADLAASRRAIAEGARAAIRKEAAASGFVTTSTRRGARAGSSAWARSSTIARMPGGRRPLGSSEGAAGARVAQAAARRTQGHTGLAGVSTSALSGSARALAQTATLSERRAPGRSSSVSRGDRTRGRTQQLAPAELAAQGYAKAHLSRTGRRRRSSSTAAAGSTRAGLSSGEISGMRRGRQRRGSAAAVVGGTWLYAPPGERETLAGSGARWTTSLREEGAGQPAGTAARPGAPDWVDLRATGAGARVERTGQDPERAAPVVAKRSRYQGAGRAGFEGMTAALVAGGGSSDSALLGHRKCRVGRGGDASPSPNGLRQPPPAGLDTSVASRRSTGIADLMSDKTGRASGVRPMHAGELWQAGGITGHILYSDPWVEPAVRLGGGVGGPPSRTGDRGLASGAPERLAPPVPRRRPPPIPTDPGAGTSQPASVMAPRPIPRRRPEPPLARAAASVAPAYDSSVVRVYDPAPAADAGALSPLPRQAQEPSERSSARRSAGPLRLAASIPQSTPQARDVDDGSAAALRGTGALHGEAPAAGLTSEGAAAALATGLVRDGKWLRVAQDPASAVARAGSPSAMTGRRQLERNADVWVRHRGVGLTRPVQFRNPATLSDVSGVPQSVSGAGSAAMFGPDGVTPVLSREAPAAEHAAALNALRGQLRSRLPVSPLAARTVLRRQLDRQDYDGDGRVNAAELGAGLSAAGATLSSADIRALCLAFDEALAGGGGRRWRDGLAQAGGRPGSALGRSESGGVRASPHPALNYTGSVDVQDLAEWVTTVPGGHGVPGWRGCGAAERTVRLAGDGGDLQSDAAEAINTAAAGRKRFHARHHEASCDPTGAGRPVSASEWRPDAGARAAHGAHDGGSPRAEAGPASSYDGFRHAAPPRAGPGRAASARARPDSAVARSSAADHTAPGRSVSAPRMRTGRQMWAARNQSSGMWGVLTTRAKDI